MINEIILSTLHPYVSVCTNLLQAFDKVNANNNVHSSTEVVQTPRLTFDGQGTIQSKNLQLEEIDENDSHYRLARMKRKLMLADKRMGNKVCRNNTINKGA